MKKAMIIILSIALVLSVSACGSADAVNPSQTPEPTAQETNYAYNQAVANSLTYISDYSVLLNTLEDDGNDDMCLGYSAFSLDRDGAVTEETKAEMTADNIVSHADYSGTNTQVEGVDEGDIVKTDGQYIYVISGDELIIFSADGPDIAELSRVTIGYDEQTDGENDWGYGGKSPSEMYIYGDKLAIISSYYSYHGYKDVMGIWQQDNESYLTVDIYDVSDPAAPGVVTSMGQDGSETASRMMDGKLYVVSAYYLYDYDGADPGTFVPHTYAEGESKLIDAPNIYIMPSVSSTSYAVICVYDLETSELLSSQTVLGAGDTVYMNESSLYLAAGMQRQEQSEPYTVSVYTVTDYAWHTATSICHFSVLDGNVTPGAVAEVEGSLGNQFYLDEYAGKLRVVTTQSGYSYKIYVDEAMGFENYVDGDDYESSSSLYILDSATMESVGSVTGLAEGEYVYSVRFDGDWAYFCTYETIDPLFAVDVSDPTAPVVVSELKITGFSEYLHIWTDGLLFGLGQETVENTEGEETWTIADGMKLVMFDVSDKANVTVKDVLTIEEDWSEALYNHKAILIDYEKNIIGFPAGEGYNIYGWTADRGFFLRARIETGDWSWGMRGLYIGDYVYVVSDSKITVLDINNFILSAALDF